MTGKSKHWELKTAGHVTSTERQQCMCAYCPARSVYSYAVQDPKPWDRCWPQWAKAFLSMSVNAIPDMSEGHPDPDALLLGLPAG